jgi:GTP-binding protein
VPSSATFVTGAAEWAQLPTDGRPELAIVGRSNVGKSSLLNALLGRKKLAYTSKTPGKTQQFNYFRVDDRFYLVDLPGYGYAKAPKAARDRWAALQARYLTERTPLRGIVHLIDSRHPPTDSDRALIERIADTGHSHLLALTKADKLSGNGRAQAEREIDACLDELGLERPVVLTSAQTNRGIGALRTWIFDRVTP